MKLKDLLSQLSYLESLPSDFSSVKLNSNEAIPVQKLFPSLKIDLEEKAFRSAIPFVNKTKENGLEQSFTNSRYQILRKKNNMILKYSVESAFVNPIENNGALESKIDLSFLLEECMGEYVLLEELVRLYKKNALEFIGSSKIHLQNEDFEQLKFASHKIKCGLSLMQTSGLHSIVLLIHKICDTDRDIKHLKFLFNCFCQEYIVAEKAIDTAMKELNNGI